MKNKIPFFSIIIATYNSEKTLEYTLKSIQNQKFDKEEREILVVDGGSTDKTIEIAKKYKAIILDNPKRLPEYAKMIGVSKAKGHYVMRMDSDEEFIYPMQLQDKMNFLKKHSEIKVLISNRCINGRKEFCGISSEYMNTLGDPFSYFVYSTKKDKCETYSKNIIFEDENEVIMKFNNTDIYPLADSATSVLSLDYMKEKYPNDYNTIKFVCSAYDIVIEDTNLCGIIKNDLVRHNCSSSFKTFLSKLKFRVINNLFYKDESGFSSKESINIVLKKRKFLFCLYSLLLPIPLLDSFRLALKYRNLTYLLHFIYVYYVCLQIVILGGVKLMGKKEKNNFYGK